MPDHPTTPDMELLRFTTAGSVDDGKSTLIGRLLYDTKTIFQDQLDSLQRLAVQRGETLNLALLTDGLRAEREQGITIDVAYRYFATPHRKFIIADTPGHIQYTRNMVTGASTANLAIILIDARNGVLEQTHRHLFIASLLGIPHFIICINKMDLVDFKEDTYETIKDTLKGFTAKLSIPDVSYIPISALLGDNIVNPSHNMPWYKGPTLLYTLENINITSDENLVDCRFPVQYVIRPRNDQFHDYRGYAGKISGGIFKPGDKVKILPSGLTSEITTIESPAGPVTEAYPPMSAVMQLKDDIDLMICWMNAKPLQPMQTYILRHTTKETKAMVRNLYYKLDINTLHRIENVPELTLNEIGRISVRTSQPLFYDSYRRNRTTGSLILIDERTNETVGAGMIRD
jgi:sulfate adenylyltransferase subunit 1